jgi:Xaa-Pro dipeptidase
MHDSQRAEFVDKLMSHIHVDALLCRLPEHVVMLTGYQPILGNSFCLVTRNIASVPEIRLILPQDEADSVPPDAVVAMETYTEETLTKIMDTVQAVREPLAKMLADAGISGQVRIGYEGGYAPVASAYTQVGIPGAAHLSLIQSLLPEANIIDATPAFETLDTIKTSADLEHIAAAENVALAGFTAARSAVKIGATEAEVAAAAISALLIEGYALPGVRHVLPFIHVMSGPRSALAYRAFNLTSQRRITRGDPVLVQMEIAIDGYWAELTRTFFAGAIDQTWQRAHAACVAAQNAALKVIRSGVSGHDTDAAARQVMIDAGFGDAFKHGLGHGFGFQAINHSAQPIVHPASKTLLQEGMVHNLEPAVYLEGQGGLRLNDNVVVRTRGCKVLSAKLSRELDWLVVPE